MAHNIFKGLGIALITPFTLDGKVDYKSLKHLLEYQLANGADFLCILATTGEAPCLTGQEKDELTAFIKDIVRGRVPILKYCGGNNTAAVVEEIKTTNWTGIDGILSICPYYNKPSQRGLYEHYKTIAKEAKFPVMLYNVPGRTGTNIEAETIAKLAELPEIVAVKEATGSLEQMIKIQDLCGDKIEILSGEDHLILPMLSIGAKGVVSVVANIMPQEMSDLISSFLNKNFNKAFELHTKLYDVSRNMFVEGNPVTVKAAMKILGKMDNDVVRLPLVAAEADTYGKLTKVFKEKGIF